jgi:hypothetical protein
MYGEQDQASVEALLEARTDTRTLAALLLKLPASKDPTINKMIRQARVAETAQQLAVAQLASQTTPKDLHQLMMRMVAIAQQIEGHLERLAMTL